MKPNAQLAYMVLDHIDAHPEQWAQGLWVGESDCGTVACFAGWAVLLSGGQVSPGGIVVEGPAELSGLDVDIAADRLLGIDTEQLMERQVGDPYDGLLTRYALGRLVEEIFGPRPAAEPVVIDHVFRLPKTGAGHLCAYMGCGLPREAHQRAVSGKHGKAKPR